jgi:hypothetical protein
MRQSVTVEQAISAKPDLIWATISAGGDVHQWFPVIQSCQLEGVGEGASRFCIMTDGSELQECIVEINHTARRFRYAINQHPLPAQNFIGSIEVKTTGNGDTLVCWSAEFDASEDAASQIKEMLQGIYIQGIQGLETYSKKQKSEV